MDNELRTFVLHEGLGRFHAGPTTDADRRFNELTFVLKKINKTKIAVRYDTIALERISIFFFSFSSKKKISKILFLCAAAAEKKKRRERGERDFQDFFNHIFSVAFVNR